MALHTRWSSGDLIFYDGTQDILTIKNGTDGIIVGESTGEVPITLYGDVTYYGEVTYPDPTTTNSTGAVTLTTTSNRTQFVDTCGASIAWVLPAIADCAGIEFKFINYSTGGVLTVNDTGGSAVAEITAGGAGYLLCDGTNWGALAAGSTF